MFLLHVVGSQYLLEGVRHSNYMPPHLKSYYYSYAGDICMSGLGSVYVSVEESESKSTALFKHFFITVEEGFNSVYLIVSHSCLFAMCVICAPFME